MFSLFRTALFRCLLLSWPAIDVTRCEGEQCGLWIVENHIKRFIFCALSAPPPRVLPVTSTFEILRSRCFNFYFFIYSASKGSSGRVTRRRLTSATHIQSFTHWKDELEMQPMWVFFKTDHMDSMAALSLLRGRERRRTEMRKPTQTEDQSDQNKIMAIIIYILGCFSTI